MNVRALLAVGVVAAVAGSAAIAAPPPGKGKPAATGPNCRPGVAVILKGTLASDPGASPSLPFALSVNVTRANRHGAAWKKASQPVAVTVTADTKIRRQGKKTLADLDSGDRVLVQARACKADLANDATPQLWAKRVVAHPAANAADESGS